MSGGTDDSLEQNDTRSGARAVSAGTSNNLVVKWFDEDWYRVTVPSGNRITITGSFEHDYGDIDMELYRGSDTTAISTSASSGDTEIVEHINTGGTTDYLVRVFLFGGVRNTYNMNVTVNQQSRTLTVASSNPSTGVSVTVSPNDNNGQGNGVTPFNRVYNNNTNVALTAPAAAGGKNFQKWQRDGVDLTTSLLANFVMDANHTLTAVYVTPPPTTRTLTVASSNPASGVSVSVSPNDNNGQGNGVTPFNRVYNNNTNVALTAPAAAGGKNFQKWQRDGVDLTTSLLANFVMDANHTLTTVYVTPPPTTRTLTVASSNPASGVSITVSPLDNNSQGSGVTQFNRVYNNNTVVSLTAPSTAGGNNFQKWQRDGADFSFSQSTNVTMDANHTMTAVYVTPPPTTRTLTVASSNPASGVSITVSPLDNNSQGSGVTQFNRVYNNNSVVSLTAPSTAGGNNFQKWQRDGLDFSFSQSTNVAMDANHTMTAVYVTQPPLTRTLTVASSNPSNGVSITVSPNDNNGQGSGVTQFNRVHNNNSVVSLTAPSTAGGNNFQKWQRDGLDFSFSQSTNVAMDANHTMTAVYVTQPPLTRTLTVASSNPSNGVSITVSPNDNNGQGSGVTQFTRVYNNNTNMALTAPATAGGNNFQKWQLDGVDNATSLLANFVMDANHTMTAVYGGCAVAPINIGLTMGGALTTSDCRSQVRGGTYYADRYSFNASAGQQVAILLTSSDFDTYLYLIGPSGSVIAEDDDGGGAFNSRIPAAAGVLNLTSTGMYTIEVTSFALNNTGSYNLTLFGYDTDGDGIPDVVELSEGTNPLVKDNDIFNNARLFVMQQYRDFLGREGDPGGISFWTNLINSGSLTRAQVIDSFFNSPEFQGTVSPVTRLYFAYFLRIPDYGGLNFWVNQYRLGATLDSISQAFAASPEFQSTYGSLSNTQFVTLLYQNVLGRAPDPGGLAFWVGQLNSVAMTRGSVMLGFSESAEYKQASFNKVYVTMIYVGMLRRAPEQGGFDFWVNALNSGASGLDLIQGFLGSVEYHSRFLP